MSTKSNKLKTIVPEKEEPTKEKPKRVKKEQKTENESVKFSFNDIVNILKDERFHKVIGIFFILFAVYLFVAFTSYLLTWKADDSLSSSSFSSLLFDKTITAENFMGKMGAYISILFIKNWFGIASYLFILLLFLSGMKIFLNIRLLPIKLTFKYCFFLLIWISLFCGYFFHTKSPILGGSFGFELNKWLTGIIGVVGTGILIFFGIICFGFIAFKLSLKWFDKFKTPAIVNEEVASDEDLDGMEIISKKNVVSNEQKNEKEVVGNSIELSINQNDIIEKKPTIEEKSIDKVEEEPIIKTTPIIKDEVKDDIEFTIENAIETNEVISTEGGEQEAMKEYDPTLDLSSYKFPTLDLLDDYGTNTVNVKKEELESNKNQIVRTLNNYSIQIEKIKATIGPTITLYEIVPAPGVRISRIKNLEDDIALSLSALGIRIIAPIPGKGTIGIEVPNQNPEIVPMRAIISSDKFVNTSYDLPIALGKTISNESYIADLSKMPHLLMAGATGQGKSVGINAIITSLLYKKHPSQLKFVLVDPKKVELSLYAKIERHFLAKLPEEGEAIITDTKKVVKTLNSLCIEMDNRYDLLKDAQVRNIKEYNTKFVARKLNPNNGHKYLPYIVLIVDEFGDLIITAGKEVEVPITRLAQLARAVGIHLIIATQRPSVNVITGTIKANFPARLAFAVSSKIDSRTILDSGGADQLIGRGDLLLSTGNDLIRIQCAFVDTHEVEKICDYIGSQRGYAGAFNLPECIDDSETSSTKTYNPNERDEFFEEAARLIVSNQHGSTSLIQRKLKLGYNRAGRIVDQLEAAGIIGPFEGSKAREVRIKDLFALEQFLKNTDL